MATPLQKLFRMATLMDYAALVDLTLLHKFSHDIKCRYTSMLPIDGVAGMQIYNGFLHWNIYFKFIFNIIVTKAHGSECISSLL